MSEFTSLVGCFPALGPEELLGRYKPSRRFAGARFSSYIPNPQHSSQSQALAAMKEFAELVAAAPVSERRKGWLRRNSAAPEARRGARYLDGGYGVGKTHLLAALWHEVDRRGVRAVYISFAELTAVVGFLGMEEAIQVFSRFRLICIDEFELDDVANTLMSVTFLRGVIGQGARVAATSNSLPERLGEGRFSADDFTREISAIASHFETIRIDGPDYRRGRALSNDLVSEERLEAVLSSWRPGNKTAANSLSSPAVSIDSFDELIAHLRLVHPVHFATMLDGLDVVAVKGLRPIANQGDALLFVQLVDDLYEAELTFLATGCSIAELFPSSYRHGGYRKKYGRCESRLSALMSEAAAS